MRSEHFGASQDLERFVIKMRKVYSSRREIVRSFFTGRRRRIVVYSTALERRHTERYREFESHRLRSVWEEGEYRKVSRAIHFSDVPVVRNGSDLIFLAVLRCGKWKYL